MPNEPTPTPAPTPAPATRFLNAVEAGRSVAVAAFEGGAGFQERIERMGLTEGSVLTILQSARGQAGPVIVMVGGMRLALGYGMAAKIRVTDLPDEG